MTYTILITETNTGYATFEDKETAEEWLQEPDYDFVKWTGTIDTKFDLVETD